MFTNYAASSARNSIMQSFSRELSHANSCDVLLNELQGFSAKGAGSFYNVGKEK